MNNNSRSRVFWATSLSFLALTIVLLRHKLAWCYHFVLQLVNCDDGWEANYSAYTRNAGPILVIVILLAFITIILLASIFLINRTKFARNRFADRIVEVFITTICLILFTAIP